MNNQSIKWGNVELEEKIDTFTLRFFGIREEEYGMDGLTKQDLLDLQSAIQEALEGEGCCEVCIGREGNRDCDDRTCPCHQSKEQRCNHTIGKCIDPKNHRPGQPQEQKEERDVHKEAGAIGKRDGFIHLTNGLKIEGPEELVKEVVGLIDSSKPQPLPEKKTCLCGKEEEDHKVYGEHPFEEDTDKKPSEEIVSLVIDQLELHKEGKKLCWCGHPKYSHGLEDWYAGNCKHCPCKEYSKRNR